MAKPLPEDESRVNCRNIVYAKYTVYGGKCLSMILVLCDAEVDLLWLL
jgi:hypothetical protein